MCFWYLVKSDLSSAHVYSIVNGTSRFIHCTRKTRQCLSGQVVNKMVFCFAALFRRPYTIRNGIFFFKYIRFDPFYFGLLDSSRGWCNFFGALRALNWSRLANLTLRPWKVALMYVWYIRQIFISSSFEIQIREGFVQGYAVTME